MENDDQTKGRVLSRREVLALFGAGGAAFLAACAGLSEGGEPTSAPAAGQNLPPTQPANPTNPTSPNTALIDPSPTYGPTNAPTEATVVPNTGSLPTCVVRPEMTEGPFFVEDMLERSDIRAEPSNNSVKEGLPLELVFNVTQIADQACTPLAGAVVDIWHCDALGVYSGVQDQLAGPNNQETSFLRGYQLTDETGMARFITIYPGWYPGRAVHIHFKIRTQVADGQFYEFTSQLFFDEAVTDQVHANPPYASKGQRNVRNEQDGLFRNGGDQLLLTAAEAEGNYRATFDIGLDLSDAQVGQSDGQGRRRRDPVIPPPR